MDSRIQKQNYWLPFADASQKQYCTIKVFLNRTSIPWHWIRKKNDESFHSGPFEEWEIFTVNADGTNLKQVTDMASGKTAINPVWRPI